jgi:hypothetical protein
MGRNSRRGRRGLLVFPARFPLARGSACSPCVLGCSHYIMTSLALFSLSRPPHPSPSPSLSPSPRPPRHLHLSLPPRLTSSPSTEHSPPPLFLLRATLGSHLTTPVLVISLEPVHPSRQSAFLPVPLHVPQLHPIACSIGNGLDRVASHSPPRPRLLLASFFHNSASPPSPRSTRTYNTVEHTYNTRRFDRSSGYMKRESSLSLFSFSSRTHRCSDGNLKPLPIHHHPI